MLGKLTGVKSDLVKSLAAAFTNAGREPRLDAEFATIVCLSY